jgi:hypothetical protein
MGNRNQNDDLNDEDIQLFNEIDNRHQHDDLDDDDNSNDNVDIDNNHNNDDDGDSNNNNDNGNDDHDNSNDSNPSDLDMDLTDIEIPVVSKTLVEDPLGLGGQTPQMRPIKGRRRRINNNISQNQNENNSSNDNQNQNQNDDNNSNNSNNDNIMMKMENQNQISNYRVTDVSSDEMKQEESKESKELIKTESKELMKKEKKEFRLIKFAEIKVKKQENDYRRDVEDYIVDGMDEYASDVDFTYWQFQLNWTRLVDDLSAEKTFEFLMSLKNGYYMKAAYGTPLGNKSTHLTETIKNIAFKINNLVVN